MICGTESAFDRTVSAILRGVDAEGGEGELFRQLMAKLFAEVRHVFKRMGVFLPQPFIDLFCPELLFAEGSEVSF